MDAPEDKDLVIQRASGDLLSELCFSVPRFIYKDPESNEGRQLRRDVSYAATAHLTRLVGVPKRQSARSIR